MKKKVLTPHEGYNLYAKSYIKDYPLLDSFDWSETENFLKTYATEDKKILDIGCGDGRIIKRLKNSNIIGTDVSETMIKLAKKRNPENTFLIADALTQPFPDNSFDIIIGFFLLVHIDNLRLFFQEIDRLLSTNGLFLCNNIPQRRAPLLEVDDKKFIIKSFDYSDRAVIKKAEKKNLLLQEKKEIIQKEAHVSTIFLFKKL